VRPFLSSSPHPQKRQERPNSRAFPSASAETLHIVDRSAITAKHRGIASCTPCESPQWTVSEVARIVVKL